MSNSALVCLPALFCQPSDAVQFCSQVADLLLRLLHQNLQHHGILLLLQAHFVRAARAHHSRVIIPITYQYPLLSRKLLWCRPKNCTTDTSNNGCSHVIACQSTQRKSKTKP
ncbi:hypothetical protein COO60DRAFT_653514 [Scenedesmus sp. NREL 46B-D3]|nr:hypothetical protein COO60DRAFT_653514 [Scenedesmus sp. NREL 46B-D3]